MPTAGPGGAETVGAVARRLGLSVRTLHHWDHLGVASPSGRTPGGYRAYFPQDVARLRRVQLLRDLEVPLLEIPSLLNANSADRRTELKRLRGKLNVRIRHLHGVRDSVDRLLKADETGVLLSGEEQARAFGAGWDPTWPAAARAKGGDSAQWAEYAERSAQRTEGDWQQVNESMMDVTEAFAEAKRRGTLPGSVAANQLAENHRGALGEYFHCTLSMQALIARGFDSEQGFANFYDEIEPGLGHWMRQVINANALSQGIDPATAAWG